MGEPDEIIDEKILTSIKNEIFGQQDIPGTDNFFDAVIDIKKTGNNNIMGSDFITPHKHESRRELDPFVNPNPIQFIKVLPGIFFEFRFNLSNSVIYPKWTSELKLKLFKTILLTLGIGAKTNVGYGQFAPQIKAAGGNATSSVQHLQLNQGKVASAIKVGDVLDAEIVNLSGGITIDLHIKDISFKPRLVGVSSTGFKLKQIIKVKVDQIGKQMKFSPVV